MKQGPMWQPHLERNGFHILSPLESGGQVMSCFFWTFGGSGFLRLKNGKHMMARNLVGESSLMILM